MRSANLAPAERIIVPLDVPTVEAAVALIDRLPQVTFWKVGLELFVSSGASVLQVLKQRHKRIFLDLKLHDIPNTVAGAAAAAARYGVDLLTVHATNGSAGLATAQTAATDAATAAGLMPPQIIAVTVLTSIDARTLAFELKVPIELPEYALNLAMLARDSGLAGAVCSPQEASQLRDVCGRDFVLVCPGVRPSWAIKGDQKRVMTPAAALAAGADYLVIGRPITAAADPVAAFERICGELELS
ncbi:orotidine-5'-phosphate decarboxylase [filamentous cyanobacterium LEGE 11480]|uniref:Orotidine 5'-phosphate decarboxylase n=1 Tax=Romeriopsis navalis LEGE 11480 TaxID=2777977 RepID=A0A928VNL4_9CYAN|nr:orotidine-5'-phosphate decarboxylase [Romeriopsis navalis]MBE9030983.1 orotidine-5'-phosphate decarboxylase [Romeriopsis navalis LEGE 11480]